MRKKNKIMICILSAFLFLGKIKGDELITKSDLINGSRITDAKLITCKYDTKKDNMNVTINLVTTNDSVNPYQTQIYIKGDFAKNKLLEPSMKSRNMSIESYLPKSSTCPKYAAMYDKKGDVVFSDDETQITDAKYVMPLKKAEYNKDYCYYNYSEIGNGLFIDKNNLGNLSNDYSSNECPSSLIVSDDLGDFLWYIGGVDTSKGIDVNTLKQNCISTIESKYGDIFSDDPNVCKVVNKAESIIIDDSGEKTDNPPLECSNLFDDETKKFINNTYFTIEIIAIILVIALTIKDYAMIILQSNQDEIKKANGRLLKRIIVTILILLLPALVKFTIKVFNIEGFDSNDPLCDTVKK